AGAGGHAVDGGDRRLVHAVHREGLPSDPAELVEHGLL
ncbi:MAG: hypothetical protein AVDCRST_MAG50-640, partial [uncultured Acidimicrobiales bacterium]